MNCVKILDYVAKAAKVIDVDTSSSWGICLSYYNGLYIVSRKGSCLPDASHEVFQTIDAAKERYSDIAKIVFK